MQLRSKVGLCRRWRASSDFIEEYFVMKRDTLTFGPSHECVTISRSAEPFTYEEGGSLSVHFGATGTVQSQMIVDGFDSTGQPPQLCSRPFYEDCYAALAPNGILAVNLCDSDVRPLVSRIRDSFTAGVIAIDIEIGVNMIVFAGKGNILWASG